MTGGSAHRWEWRRVLSVVFLCVPTVCVVLISIWFMIERVPELIRDEHKRVLAEYRLVAAELQSCTNELARIEVQDEWKTAGKMKPGKWGVEIGSSGKAFVWYRDGEDAFGTTTDVIDETDFVSIFWIAGSSVLLLLSGMTLFGVRFFLDYVRSRDDFLVATAHDLKTPLVGMRMAIGRSDGDVRVLTERMLRIVENIKDFMKLGGKRPSPKREEFDVVKAYNEAYALFRDDYRDLLDGEDVAVSDEGVPPALADETMTVQVLWNLLGNDLKYAAPDGAVKVRFFADGKFVKVEFADEGQGMTPRQMRHAFDRYYRAKTVLESGKGGFGIGLCTAREFAEAMGGSLAVRANSPRGCVFTLSLPAADRKGPR